MNRTGNGLRHKGMTSSTDNSKIISHKTVMTTMNSTFRSVVARKSL